MTDSTAKKQRIKWDLFKRDGWFDQIARTWKAYCAFGCGTELVFSTATIDHYPIMACDGGPLSVANGRLACGPCNHCNANHKEKKYVRPEWANKKKWRAWQAEERDLFPEIYANPFPQYPVETRNKLKQNYPKSKGRDKNGIPYE